MATEWHPESAALRRRAEIQLAKERGPLEAAGEALSPAESAFLEVFHELRVHQVELELQNEELRRVQATLEESHDALAVSEQRYRDLFENAPVAYLQLDHEGRIRSANGFALALLDIEPAALGRDKFSEFASAPSQDAYYLYRRALLEGRRPGPIEIELRATIASPRFQSSSTAVWRACPARRTPSCSSPCSTSPRGGAASTSARRASVSGG